MAGTFHATFKSRGDNTMELVFDDAEWGDGKTLSGVEVEIFERDRSLGLAREPSKDDALGTVKVDLEQGPPNKHGTPTVVIKAASFLPPINPAHVKSGTFDLIAGPETFRLDVFMEPEEWPHGKPPPWAIVQRDFIELALVVSAPGKQKYSSLDKKVRPDRLGVLRGPVLTYIVKAAGAGDAMADNAARFWEPRSDRTVRPTSGMMSLEEVLEDIDRDIGVDLVWKQVNIVTHGNLAGLLMPLKKGENVKELTQLDVRELDRRTFEMLDEKASHIVIRGCSIGRDRDLLRMLSSRLGECRVFAPKTHLIAYHHFEKGSTERTRELLYRRYWAFRPGSNENVGAKTMAKLLDAQKDTMPSKPTRPFETLVSKPFGGSSKAIPEFFRRTSDAQVHTFHFPQQGSEEILEHELEADPGLRDGRTKLLQLLQSKDGERHKAEITQPDHVPIVSTDAVWSDLEALKKRGHWAIEAKNLEDEVVDPGDPDPTHMIRARVILSRVKVEACELHGEITDTDVTKNPEFGSS